VNRLGLSIIILAVIALGIKVFMKINKPLSSFKTMQTLFDVDTNWSSDFQKKIVDIIKDDYKNSNDPEAIIQKLVQEFKEIHDMKAEICGVDTICFHMYGFKPVFILGGTKVVVSNGSILEKKNFDQDMVDGLPSISSQKNDQVISMIYFIQSMPNEILQNYVIDWVDKNYIILQSKKHEGMRCLLSDILIPKEKTFEECSLLYDASLQKLPKKKQNKHMVEYDIRFRNQIIVRSGGNYG